MKNVLNVVWNRVVGKVKPVVKPVVLVSADHLEELRKQINLQEGRIRTLENRLSVKQEALVKLLDPKAKPPKFKRCKAPKDEDGRSLWWRTATAEQKESRKAKMNAWRYKVNVV